MRGHGKPHYIYRVYDAEDVLLYVGVTFSVGRRMCEHERLSPWHRFAVRVETDGPFEREVAYGREARTIRELRPVFNDRSNDAWRQGAYLDSHVPDEQTEMRRLMVEAMARIPTH